MLVAVTALMEWEWISNLIPPLDILDILLTSHAGIKVNFQVVEMDCCTYKLRNWWFVLYIKCTISCQYTVYPKKYAHGFCFAVLCCGYTLTGFPISIRLTSLALWQFNDCPSASKATLMNMDKYFMWIHDERLHNHNKEKHNKTVCIFLGIYCRIFVNILRPRQISCHFAVDFSNTISCTKLVAFWLDFARVQWTLMQR